MLEPMVPTDLRGAGHRIQPAFCGTDLHAVAKQSVKSLGLIAMMACLSGVLATAANAGECSVIPIEQATTGPDGIELLPSNLIMSENFNNSANFAVPFRGARCIRSIRPECDLVPEGWTNFYSSERWHPQQGEPDRSPSMQISSEQFRGRSGKSLVIWDESHGGPSTWGSDAILARNLNEEIKDVYAEFYILFEPGYRWHHIERGSGTNLAKLFRLTHFDGGDASPFKFFGNGDSAPLFFLDLNIWTTTQNGSTVNRTGLSSAVRCDPQENNYRCNNFTENELSRLTGSPSFAESLGDGNWHKIGVRVAMNSSPGARDGIITIWVDDVQIGNRDDVPFLGPGAPAGNGWNMVMLGGNMHNYPEAEGARFEQWSAIDDFKLYRLD